MSFIVDDPALLHAGLLGELGLPALDGLRLGVHLLLLEVLVGRRVVHVPGTGLLLLLHALQHLPGVERLPELSHGDTTVELDREGLLLDLGHRLPALLAGEGHDLTPHEHRHEVDQPVLEALGEPRDVQLVLELVDGLVGDGVHRRLHPRLPRIELLGEVVDLDEVALVVHLGRLELAPHHLDLLADVLDDRVDQLALALLHGQDRVVEATRHHDGFPLHPTRPVLLQALHGLVRVLLALLGEDEGFHLLHGPDDLGLGVLPHPVLVLERGHERLVTRHPLAQLPHELDHLGRVVVLVRDVLLGRHDLGQQVVQPAAHAAQFRLVPGADARHLEHEGLPGVHPDVLRLLLFRHGLVAHGVDQVVIRVEHLAVLVARQDLAHELLIAELGLVARLPGDVLGHVLHEPGRGQEGELLHAHGLLLLGEEGLERQEPLLGGLHLLVPLDLVGDRARLEEAHALDHAVDPVGVPGLHEDPQTRLHPDGLALDLGDLDVGAHELERLADLAGLLLGALEDDRALLLLEELLDHVAGLEDVHAHDLPQDGSDHDGLEAHLDQLDRVRELGQPEVPDLELAALHVGEVPVAPLDALTGDDHVGPLLGLLGHGDVELVLELGRLLARAHALLEDERLLVLDVGRVGHELGLDLPVLVLVLVDDAGGDGLLLLREGLVLAVATEVAALAEDVALVDLLDLVGHDLVPEEGVGLHHDRRDAVGDVDEVVHGLLHLHVLLALDDVGDLGLHVDVLLDVRDAVGRGLALGLEHERLDVVDLDADLHRVLLRTGTELSHVKEKVACYATISFETYLISITL